MVKYYTKIELNPRESISALIRLREYNNITINY